MMGTRDHDGERINYHIRTFSETKAIRINVL